MSMDGMDMSGGSMSMGAGVPSLFHMQKIYWAFAGTAIGAAATTHLYNILICRQRLSAVSKNHPMPSRPNQLLPQAQATIAAVVREISYYSFKPITFRNFTYHLPPLGPILLIVANIVLIVICCFYRLDPSDQWKWEDIGYRSGFIGVAQMPLIILLSSKRNIVGFLTGAGYERLNFFHRWTARCLLFTILIHMGYWFTDWARYDYILIKIRTDSITQMGLSAFGVLAWLVLSSMAPIRGLSYEFFVVQHIISWIGFLVLVYKHIPAENKIWVWIPLGIWAFDRVVRAGYMVYNNLGFLHQNNSKGLLACRATFEPTGDSHTRIIIQNPPISWTPGQHIFLTCQPLAPLTSHPFTICSLPSDGKMEFIVRAQKGATKRFMKYAEKIYATLPTSEGEAVKTRSVMIEGPYAQIRPLRQFDTVVFLAGSTGATFTMPLMRDLVQQWTSTAPDSLKSRIAGPKGAVTRYIRFIWVIKRSQQTRWFAAHLNDAVASVEELRARGIDVELDISIYVTCDDELTSGKSPLNSDTQQSGACGQRSPESDTSGSPSFDGDREKDLMVNNLEVSNVGCCCTRVVEDEDDDAIRQPCCCAQKREGGTVLRQIYSSSSDSKPTLSKRQETLHSRINCLSGRPDVCSILRKSVERAFGETAVVVCGPKGLVGTVRNNVVNISDERAVHKGTGAQGIWVHGECFGY